MKAVQQPVHPDPKPVVKTSGDKYIENTRVLPAGKGLYFRIQIIATGVAFDARELFIYEGIDQEVMVERHEGMYKYTAGSFESYNQAEAYRNRVERLQSVEGAFVIAYRDGKRISINSVR